ncbi:MAG: leucine-rich repeat domain-containing protein [Bacteroidaceae bacterium]|nr:leucine-rich repeat domain-containing protein [Bacteroidaceae bacterium]
MKKHLLFIFAALLPMLASAEKVEINGIWYNLVSMAKVAEVTFKGDSFDSYNEYSGSITIPATVTYEGVTCSVKNIGDEAFRRCRSLTAITIPEGVKSIGERAFASCESLTSITIPEGVTSIETLSFSGCSSLTAITLPVGLTSIRYSAFYGCSRLTTIVLPKSVNSIGYKAFANCSELTDVYCNAEEIPYTDTKAFHESNIENATLHVPASAVNEYKNTAPWSSFGNIVALTDEEMGVEQLTIDNARITIYDLHGRRVATPTKDGIYIVDGKKVMVKIGM